MFCKMLKFTTILFVLIAFVVVPVVVLSGEETTTHGYKCKGEFDVKGGKLQSCSAKTDDGNAACGAYSRTVSATAADGCVTEAYGFICTEWFETVEVGTEHCHWVTSGGETCEVKTSTMEEKDFKACSHVES